MLIIFAQTIVISFAVLLCTAFIAGAVWVPFQLFETYVYLTKEANALQLISEDQEREHAQIL